MSGGSFNSSEFHLLNIAEEIDNLIAIHSNEYSEEVYVRMQETSMALKKAYNMTHLVDYLLGGDHSEETFFKEWTKMVQDEHGRIVG